MNRNGSRFSGVWNTKITYKKKNEWERKPVLMKCFLIVTSWLPQKKKKKKNTRTDKNLPKKRFGNSDFLILCFAAEK